HDRAAVGPDRDGHRSGRGDRGGPAAGGDEHAFCADVATCGTYAGDAIAFAEKRLDSDALAERRAVEVGRGCESGKRREWVGVPVARAEPAAEDVVRADPRSELRDLNTIHHADRGTRALAE